MRKFLREVFSSSDSASWSRLGSMMALVAVIAWNTYILRETKKLPTPEDLKGQSYFIGMLYGIGAFKDVAKAVAARFGQGDK